MRRILIVLVFAGVAFGSGVAVDRYALSRLRSRHAGSSAGSDSLGESISEFAANNTDDVVIAGQPGGKPVTAASSVDSIVAALRNAMNRPNDRRGYLVASK